MSYTNSLKCIISGSDGILYEDDRFHVTLDEDIRLSRIANGDREADNSEQEHVDKIVEEPHRDLVDEELLPQELQAFPTLEEKLLVFF